MSCIFLLFYLCHFDRGLTMLQYVLALFQFLVLIVRLLMFISFLGILIIFPLLAEAQVYTFTKLFWAKNESGKWFLFSLLFSDSIPPYSPAPSHSRPLSVSSSFSLLLSQGSIQILVSHTALPPPVDLVSVHPLAHPQTHNKISCQIPITRNTVYPENPVADNQ